MTDENKLSVTSVPAIPRSKSLTEGNRGASHRQHLLHRPIGSSASSYGGRINQLNFLPRHLGLKHTPAGSLSAPGGMMSKQLQAVLMIARHPVMRDVLLPIINQQNETIFWEKLDYGVLSGGMKTAASWARAVWSDELPPKQWRDPFEGFPVMSRELQRIVLAAVAYRHS